MRHKHADLIKAWADGATIQAWSAIADGWVDLVYPNWVEDIGFRIKPDPKPDVVRYCHCISGFGHGFKVSDANIIMTFDG